MSKTKCDAIKVYNAATGKCVLRTGKIGQQILGTAAPKTAAAKPKRAKARPLTIEEVRRNWPEDIAKLIASKSLERDDAPWDSNPWWYHGLPRFFGPGAEYLTDDRIKELLPNPGDTTRIAVTYEKSGDADYHLILDPAQAWTVTLHRPASAAELWKYRATDSDSAREIFDVRRVVVSGETRFRPDYATAKMPTEELARRVVIATFSGRTKFMNNSNNSTKFMNNNTTSSQPRTIFELGTGDSGLGLFWTRDSRFITWIAPSKSRAVNAVVVVNANNRGGQKVAASRKAPAGHAKNFANQTARGIDGKVWRSSQVKVKNSIGKYRTTYRWVPVTVK